MGQILPDRILDSRGEYCPLPVIHTKQVIDEMAVGQVLELLADDRAAEEDIQRWAKRTGHEVIHMAWEDGRLVFHIRKAQ